MEFHIEEWKDDGDIQRMFDLFLRDLGPEGYAMAYSTKMTRLDGERVFVAVSPYGKVMGWHTVRKVRPDTYRYRGGTFRDSRNLGVRMALRECVARVAFEDPECQELEGVIKATNAPQVVHCLKDHLSGAWMRLVKVTYKDGEVPALWFSLSRAQWDALDQRSLG